MKIADEDKIRIPSASRMERLTELLKEDEDFRFATLKLNRNKKPRYELPEPTRDDRDNIESSATFKAVVLVARPNFYASDEDKEKGREPKEKRVLYIMRPGKITPERIFISPTGVKNWKAFCLACSKQGIKFYQVVCEFSAEHVDPPKSEFSWNRAKFAIDRHLTEEETEHVLAVRTLVDERVVQYEDESELDRAEAEQMGKTTDDDDAPDKHSKKRRTDIEDDDDEDEKPKGKPGSGKAKKDDSKAKAKKSDDDDDDEDEKPKGGKSKPKNGYPDLDDDDEEDLDKTKKKSKKSDDDDEDEDEKPKGKSKSKSKADDDDDEDEKPKGGKSKSKSLDDDDDDED